MRAYYSVHMMFEAFDTRFPETSEMRRRGRNKMPTDFFRDESLVKFCIFHRRYKCATEFVTGPLKIRAVVTVDVGRQAPSTDKALEGG